MMWIVQLDNKVLIEQIEELAQILNKWNEQLVVGGGVALVLYDVVLSKANSGAVGTTDIDYLIPRKPVKTGDEQISKILITHGYEPKTKSMNHPSVESFIKQIEDVKIEIEFLTDNKSRSKEEVVVIKDAGLNAQALSYIEMSLLEATLTYPLHHSPVRIGTEGVWTNRSLRNVKVFRPRPMQVVDADNEVIRFYLTKESDNLISKNWDMDSIRLVYKTDKGSVCILCPIEVYNKALDNVAVMSVAG